MPLTRTLDRRGFLWFSAAAMFKLTALPSPLLIDAEKCPDKYFVVNGWVLLATDIEGRQYVS